jgi:nucleotide-binding universal stress UspA family protein
MGPIGLPKRHTDALDEMIYYLVDTPDGPVGVLDGCERDEHGRPMRLIVSQGWFGRRRLGIPLEELIKVDHEGQRIIVARGAALPDRGLVHRLAEIGQRSRAPDNAADSRPEADTRRSVLCGVDDSQRSPTVVAVAAQLARQLAVPLVVAHVTPADIPPGVSAAPAGQERLHKQQAEDAGHLIDVLISRVTAGTDIGRIVITGDPAKSLVELAAKQNASLLVIGSGGKRAVSAALTGSVSRHVANNAPCPVVIVPPTLSSTQAYLEERPDQGAASGL